MPKNFRPSIVFFCALILIGANSVGQLGAEPVKIIANDFAHAQAQADGLTIIDVRTPNEWRQSGMPAGAKGATIYRGKDQSDFLAEIAKITGGDKAAPVALICAHGVRSARAAEILSKAGYRQVYDIKGGMLGDRQSRGWTASNLPIRPCDKC